MVADEDVFALLGLAGDLDAKHECNAKTAKRASELNDDECNCKAPIVLLYRIGIKVNLIQL